MFKFNLKARIKTCKCFTSVKCGTLILQVLRKSANLPGFKGIVSRVCVELQMISVDSLEVLSIAGSYFTFFNNVFMLKYLKKKRLRYGIWLSLHK